MLLQLLFEDVYIEYHFSHVKQALLTHTGCGRGGFKTKIRKIFSKIDAYSQVSQNPTIFEQQLLMAPEVFDIIIDTMLPFKTEL